MRVVNYKYARIEDGWITNIMERSLNSSRNFKLPPIQGAAPAANILRQVPSKPSRHDTGSFRSVAISNQRGTVKTRSDVHTPSDPFPGYYRSPHSCHLSTTTVYGRGLNSVSENARNTKLTLELSAIGHQFPQSYAVLPPIQKVQQPFAGQSENRTKATASRDIEERRSADSTESTVVLNSATNHKHRLKDTRKYHHHEQAGNVKELNHLETEKRAPKSDKNCSEEQAEERKPSATLLLFLKGSRKGRRVGICVENEPSLINVTERLKEIFLRRNMEEMYLI